MVPVEVISTAEGLCCVYLACVRKSTFVKLLLSWQGPPLLYYNLLYYACGGSLSC